MRRRFINNSKNIHNNFNYSNYLTIESVSPYCYVSFSNDCEYTIDGSGIWIQLSANTYTKRITKGQTLSFRGNLISTYYGIGTFFVQGDFNLKGNCMSMLFGDNAANNYSLMDNNLRSLFENCTGMLSVSENFLPATTLVDDCYNSMFKGCTNLVNVPELPAISLATRCYSNMFNGCTSLVAAPELPATILHPECYAAMFFNCTSLVTAPELPAISLSNSCYTSMFSGCTSLITAPKLPATELTNTCYYEMFRGCSSLVNAPELPAISLRVFCYDAMFYGCKKLNYIKAMFTTTPSSSYTDDWVNGVASSGTFVKNKNATWDVTGVNGIPSG